MVTVHEWSGLLLPVPFLARSRLPRLPRRPAPCSTASARTTGSGCAPRCAATTAARSRPAGKFNAGQKLYAAWIAGAVLVMLGTGLLMWFTRLAPLVWRTSATFVHDWLALAIGIVLAGHIGMALADPEARRACAPDRGRPLGPPGAPALAPRRRARRLPVGTGTRTTAGTGTRTTAGTGTRTTTGIGPRTAAGTRTHVRADTRTGFRPPSARWQTHIVPARVVDRLYAAG